MQTTLRVGFQPSTTSPSGADTTLDSNAAVSTVTLTNDLARDETIDFGFLSCPGFIGDFVWQDLNLNGVQDPVEPGYPGVIGNLKATDKQ